MGQKQIQVQKKLKVITVGVKSELNVNGFVEEIADHGNADTAPFERQMRPERG